jgi:hypothetical protein
MSLEPQAVAASPDGKLGLAATEEAVWLLSLNEGRILEQLPLARNQDAPRAVAFSPDGAAFVVGTRRGVVLEFGLLP